MNANPDLTVVIQAGGESRRMGHDKGLRLFLGEPLAERLKRHFLPIATQCVLVSNRPLDYGFLGLQVFPDAQPGIGALGGLLTALSIARTPLVAVIACDMPFACPELIQYQVWALEDKNVEAVLPKTQAGLEPFHAVYRIKPCLDAVQAALDAGEKKAGAWLERVQAYFISMDELAVFEPAGLILSNLNTHDEWIAAEQFANQAGLER